jgi:multiple sugar transport system substrate-binding protein
MRKQRTVAVILSAAVLALTACSSGGGGDENTDTSADQNSLTVWTTEDQADRVATQQAILDKFAESSGTQVELVTIGEDQLSTVLSSSAAAGELPDVIGALSLNGVNQLYTDDLLDTEAAEAIVQDLGEDTFSPRALELTSDGDTQLSVPSDGFAQLLFYRKDLFDKAGLDAPTSYEAIETAAKELNKDGMAGIVAATAPADSFTQQTFEQFALANGCELVNDQGDVTLDSDQCKEAFDFYANLLKNYSVPGNQDADTTRAGYFAGDAAMTVWSSFLLDELAGLRNDALPTCPECAADPGFLAKNTGIVSAISGPQGSDATGFGEIVSWNVLQDASPKAKDLVEFMMSDGYQDWLAVAPEGKVPTRLGTQDNASEYADAWQSLPAGVDKKEVLSAVYPAETLKEISDSPSQFARWGIPQGQGALAAAVGGQFIAPQALAGMINSGTSVDDAVEQAQQDAEGVKSDIGQ